MSKNRRFWKVECTRGIKTLYSTEIPVSNIGENKLKELLRELLSRYALTDDEVTELYISIPFKKKKKYFDVIRCQNDVGEKPAISYMASASSISITATLVERPR